LKDFVQRNINTNPNFVFPSGHYTSNSNLFTFVKMGFVLKNMTIGPPAAKLDDDEESKQGEEENLTQK